VSNVNTAHDRKTTLKALQENTLLGNLQTKKVHQKFWSQGAVNWGIALFGLKFVGDRYCKKVNTFLSVNIDQVSYQVFDCPRKFWKWIN